MEITHILLNPEIAEKAAISDSSITAIVVNGRETVVEMSASAGPRAFFEKIARAIERPFCVLAAQHLRMDPEKLSAVAQSIAAQHADMAVARLVDAEGRQTALPRRIEELRFSALVPPGTAVFTREHFVRTAKNLPNHSWDQWWHFDLIRTAAAHGLVCLSPETVAAVPGPSLSSARAESLVPLRRGGEDPSRNGEPVIVVYGALEASVSLYFEGLPPDLQRQIRFLSPSDPQTDLSFLALASAVIIVRDFEHLIRNGLLDLLEAMEVPLFWFTDDHLGALRSEYAAFRFYDAASMQAFLSRMRGIFTSTAALAEVYEKQHGTVTVWPCVFDSTLAAALSPETDPASLRIGAFGGGFRRKSFLRDVLPAIREFRSRADLTLYVRSDLARGVAPSDAVPMPFDSSYRQFVFRWQRLGLHAVAHPSGKTANIACKSLGSLLTARYLGAIPLVGDEPAHRDLGEAQGVLVAGRDSRSWNHALEHARNPAERARLFHALDLWCRKEFNPEKSRPPFLWLAAMLPKQVDAERRLARAILHPKWKEIVAPSIPNGNRLSLLKKIRKWPGWKRLEFPLIQS
jgi:hypothetical protein